MNNSELVRPQHLARKAVIYIRQSTPQQVLNNQESLELQYALQQRALALGWPQAAVEVVDSDLGLTGTSITHRLGFQEMVAQVTLGQVGIILSTDVTRLSRNCSDWYPLLDVCGYKQCLIADRDGIYDPASINGRLLLGLKGQLSELELYTIRARMVAGMRHKAERGELVRQLPIGLARNELGEVEKYPHQEVQARIQLVFDSFLQLKTASKVLRFFNEQELYLPSGDRSGELIWKKPTIGAILNVLKNPAYGGTYAYGRSQTTRDATGKATTKRLPMAQWQVCIQDKYPGYVSWPTFVKIQAMLEDNHAEYDRNKTRGVPRPGAALLHGLVYCGQCGHKMVVQYKGGTQYLCNFLRQKYQVPVCQWVPGDFIDAQVVNAFFQALAPAELDVYEQAMASYQEVEAQVAKGQQQQLERLRYQAALIERQFNRVDPDNRLVAAELEKRWEAALRQLKQAVDTHDLAQQQQEQPSPEDLSPALKEAFMAIGQKLPQIWSQDILTRAHKKALLRCLIDKVVLDRVVPDTVHTRIVWRGGDTTTLDIPVPVGSFAALSRATEMEAIILDLSHQGKSDEDIADHLTALGHRSPSRPDKVLPNTVKMVRLQHGVFQVRSQSHPRRIPGYLTLPQVAQALQVNPHWLYHQINKGAIQVKKDTQTGLYLFLDTPDTLIRLRRFQAGKCDQLRFPSREELAADDQNVG
jgi:DNA invertase Pin-like site-specific DNA recombinase